MLLILKKILKEKYNKSIEDMNGKQLINIIRHNNLSDEFKEKYNTNNIGEALYIALNNISTKPKCYCGNELKYINFSKGYREFCSGKCMSNSKSVRIKIENTSIKKYGTKHTLQNKSIREKIENTCMKKYGFNNPAKSEVIKRKIIKKSKHTFKKNFFDLLISGDRLKNEVEPLFNISEYNGILESYNWKCLKCGDIFSSNLISGKIPYCPKCNKDYSSKQEKEIYSFLKNDLHLKPKTKNRTLIYPLELDIVIPEKKIAIEFNGLYWHSESMGKNRKYHLNKTNLCEEKGYQLIHIFEDEWRDKKEIVKSIIKAKMSIFDTKIFGRKCIIKDVKRSGALQFLNNNHIQGFINGSHIGLFYENKLVSLATFGKSRHNKLYSFELLRFCTKKNTQVLGGLSKLIKAWRKNNIGNILSYADRRYSVGTGYSMSGFKMKSISNPNYWYIKNGYRESRIKYQKHKLSKLLQIFDSNLTEYENMLLNGYDRVFDCGNLIFEI